MRKLSIKWLDLLAAALLYIAIGLIFFSVQNLERCVTECTQGQLLPVVLLPVGFIGLILLFTIEPT